MSKDLPSLVVIFLFDLLRLLLASSEAELDAEHDEELEIEDDCELTDIVEKAEGFMWRELGETEWSEVTL